MSFIYVEIPHLKYKSKPLYYRKHNVVERPIIMEKEGFVYFFGTNQSRPDTMRRLGKYKGLSKMTSGTDYYDSDYPVYVFGNETIRCTQKDNIFCIRESDLEITTNMELVDDMQYMQNPVYRRKLV